MKIQQMAFMLIAVFIFFALVGMFLLTFKMGSLREKATLLQEKNAMLLLTKIAESPEFSCGEAFGNNRKTNCVDVDKVMVLKESATKYNGFWGISNIEVRKIYPTFDEKIVCDYFNYPECNVIEIVSGESEGIGLSNFVSLCRKEYVDNSVQDICELGRIIISYEIK